MLSPPTILRMHPAKREDLTLKRPPYFRAILAFAAEMPGVGWFLKGTKEALAELASEADDAELERRIEELFAVGQQTNEQVRWIGAVAMTMFEQQTRLIEYLQERQLPALPAQLTELAKEAALAAYRGWVANDLMYADHRGIEGVTRHEHVASLQLDDVYVLPRLVSQREQAQAEERALDLLDRLHREAELAPDRRAQLEMEYVVVTGERWRPGPESEDEGLALGDALRDSRSAVVIGGPGVGKSTLSRYLARVCALGADEMETRLGWGEELTPVLLPLALFAEARRERPFLSLRGFLDERLVERGGEALRAAVADAFADGTMMILLDGVDEVPDTRDRGLLVQAVEEFIADHDSSRVLVTSRPYGYVRLRGDLPHYTLPNFSHDQVEEFIRKWQWAYERKQHPRVPDEAKAEAEAEALLAEIRRNPRVEEIAANPLMLVIVSLIRYERARLPDERVQLYHKAVNTLMDTWNQWRSRLGREVGGTTLPVDRLVRVWGAVAEWTRRERNTGVFHRAELKRRLVEVLRTQEYDDGDPEATAESYLRAAAQRAGILEERGTDVFAFWHPTFEEFLAAVELATPTSRVVGRLVPLADDPRWREVILLAVGYVGIVQRDPETAMEIVCALLDHDPPALEPLLHNRLLLAAECVAECAGVLRRSLTQEVLRRFVRVSLDQPYPVFTITLAHTLHALQHLEPDPETVDVLAAVAAISGQGRQDAVRILANVAGTNARAREACESVLADEAAWYAHVQAAMGLVRAGQYGPAVMKALGKLTQGTWSDPQPFAFLSQAPDELWAAVRDDLFVPDPDRRYQAASLFITAGRADEAVVATLRDLLLEGRGNLKFQVIERLRALGQCENEVRTAMETLLDASRAETRAAGAQELLESGVISEDAVRTLKEVAVDTTDGQASLMAMLALSRSGLLDAEVLDVWREALNANDPGLRFNAATTLLDFGFDDQEVVNAFRSLLHDGSPGGQSMAAGYLLKLGIDDSEVVGALKAQVSAETSLFASNALAQLRGIGQIDEGVLGTLRRGLEAEEEWIRLRSARFLLKLGESDDAVLDVLWQLLESGDGKWALKAYLSLPQAESERERAQTAFLDLIRRHPACWRELSTRVASHDERKPNLSEDRLASVLKEHLGSSDKEVRSRAGWDLLRMKRVDDEVLDVWINLVSIEPAPAMAACRRVRGRESPASEDGEVLAELTRPRLDDTEEQRLVRIWLFDWLYGECRSALA
jgi:hypothetical protein